MLKALMLFTYISFCVVFTKKPCKGAFIGLSYQQAAVAGLWY